LTSYVDDNEFPKVLFKEGSAPATPASGDQVLYIPTSTRHLTRKDSSGTVVDLETVAGGVSSITGTSNQVIASASTGAVTLSTPQSIGTSSSPTFASLAFGGLTGATTAIRIVGGTASGAPVSGTFSTGDVVIDVTGNIWVCTAGGTPGTWGRVGSGGSGAVTQINKTTLGSPASSISVSSISGSYNALWLILDGRSSTSATFTTALLQLNSDTAANYDWNRADTNTSGGWATNSGGIGDTSVNLGYINADTSPASTSSGTSILIPNYAGTTFHKHLEINYSLKTANSAGSVYRGVASGWWRSVAAITAVTLTPTAGNFMTGTTLLVYGIN